VIPVDATPAWHAAHPGALIGLLEIANVDNSIAAPPLEVRKREVELALCLPAVSPLADANFVAELQTLAAGHDAAKANLDAM
jgi:hypothetical protein